MTRDSFKANLDGVPQPQTQPHSPALPTPRTLLTRPRRTHKHDKMQRSGLVFLLLGSAACFDIDIAPPKLGLRRLFRRPYRGPICVIEIIGAELTPIANSGTARYIPCGPPTPPSWLLWLRYHFGRAAEPHLNPVRGSDEAAGAR